MVSPEQALPPSTVKATVPVKGSVLPGAKAFPTRSIFVNILPFMFACIVALLMFLHRQDAATEMPTSIQDLDPAYVSVRVGPLFLPYKSQTCDLKGKKSVLRQPTWQEYFCAMRLGDEDLRDTSVKCADHNPKLRSVIPDDENVNIWLKASDDCF